MPGFDSMRREKNAYYFQEVGWDGCLARLSTTPTTAHMSQLTGRKAPPLRKRRTKTSIPPILNVTVGV